MTVSREDLKKGSKRRSIIARAIGAVVLGCMCFAATDLLPPSENPGRLHGLGSIPVDEWLSRLMPVEGEVPPLPRASVEEIVSAYDRSLSEGSVHEGLKVFHRELLEKLAQGYFKVDEHLEVARRLLAAREKVRLRGPQERIRPALYLLNVLTEETLYAATLKFPVFPSVWKFRGEGAGIPCEVGSSESGYHGLAFCEGDLILSKGGEFSAALTLFRSPYTATFSHVGFAFRAPRLGLLEADGFQGSWVSLESDLPPARVAVYRSLAKGTAGAIARARELKRPFGFNFSLEPRCQEGVYYCSELLYCLYDRGAKEDAENPYARKYWTPTTEKVDNFISRVWKVHWGPVPAPGDVELNPQFQLTEYGVALGEISTLRIQQQSLEAFLALLREDVSLREGYVRVLTALGTARLSSLDSSRTRILEIMSGLRREQIDVLKRRLPPEIRVPEVLFYYHVEERLLPSVEDRLERAVQLAGYQGVPIGKLQSLAKEVVRTEIQRLVELMRVQRDAR